MKLKLNFQATTRIFNNTKYHHSSGHCKDHFEDFDTQCFSKPLYKVFFIPKTSWNKDFTPMFQTVSQYSMLLSIFSLCYRYQQHFLQTPWFQCCGNTELCWGPFIDLNFSLTFQNISLFLLYIFPVDKAKILILQSSLPLVSRM